MAALAAAAAAFSWEEPLLPYLDTCIDASSAAAAGASLVSGSFGLGGTARLGTGVREEAGVGARREEAVSGAPLVGLPVRGVTIGRGDAVRAGTGSELGATVATGSCSSARRASSGTGSSSARRASTRRSRPRCSSAGRFCFCTTCSRRAEISAFSSSSAAAF